MSGRQVWTYYTNKALPLMGFGDSFIKWIRLLYRNPRCFVMVNGHISTFFFPSRGVRQGCPLSPLLYVFSMKALACNVRTSPVIQGITLPSFSPYMRMTFLSSFRRLALWRRFFFTYARFERGTGSKLNLDKCEGLWLGGWRGCPDSPVPFQWTSNKIKV